MIHTVKHILTFLIFGFVLTPALKAQTSSITLHIISEGTGILVENAKVEIMDTNWSALSDQNGKATLTGLPADVYVITVQHPNFRDHMLGISIQPGSEVTKTITLIPQLEELIITETRRNEGFRQRLSTGSGTYLTGDRISNTGAVNIADVIRQIPGVSVRQLGTRLLAIADRSAVTGLNTPCGLDIYVDGNNIGGVTPDLNLIPTPPDIAAIEIYKNQASIPAEFNRFNACGAIIIWTKSFLPDEG